LKSEAGVAAPVSDDAPAFESPERPRRRLTPGGGVEYEGEVLFALEPVGGAAVPDLDERLGAALSADRYVDGDFFELPQPVYLVHDEALSTTFRAAVRPDRIELHMLPDTDPAALAELYVRVAAASDRDWRVDREVTPP